jgi:hypothetical protein
MTQLSPATEAVLDAGLQHSVHRYSIAAALRAAASTLREAYINEEYVDSADDWLDAIADELEGDND